jgi:hypothetical protein
MALTTNREGMRKALDAMRIGRDPRIAGADFILPLSEFKGMAPRWAEFGVQKGDHVRWEQDRFSDTIAIRIVLREEAPTFVDLMAA